MAAKKKVDIVAVEASLWLDATSKEGPSPTDKITDAALESALRHHNTRATQEANQAKGIA